MSMCEMVKQSLNLMTLQFLKKTSHHLQICLSDAPVALTIDNHAKFENLKDLIYTVSEKSQH